MKLARWIELFPLEARSLLQVRGEDLFTTLGPQAIRDVVAQVLGGQNIRNATEVLTRKRLSALNAALVVMYLRGVRRIPGFAETLPAMARREFLSTKAGSADRMVLLWSLGLTTKQVQNVLRSDSKAWDDYVERFATGVKVSAAAAEEAYGTLAADVSLGADKDTKLGWLPALYMLAAIGSQTLGIRGSEKAIYGKLFEKLILAAVLHVLGFTLSAEGTATRRAFWLSSRERKRESDATAVVEKGVVIRFDIGFIGPGNTEISLDKVSRFEREIEIAGRRHFAHTFVIVDRIGKGSRIVGLAEAIEGKIIQMSASYWPQALGDAIAAAIPRFESPLSGLSERDLKKVIAQRLKTAPFHQFFSSAILSTIAEEPATYGSSGGEEVAESNDDDE